MGRINFFLFCEYFFLHLTKNAMEKIQNPNITKDKGTNKYLKYSGVTKILVGPSAPPMMTIVKIWNNCFIKIPTRLYHFR